MDSLGRYYTQELFSNLLISQFNQESPKKIIDIGAGGGSLIKAASNRWGNASFYGADIDRDSILKVNSELPFVKIIYANSLNRNIDEKLKLKIGSVDIAVSNPPYLKIKNKGIYQNLFNEVDLKDCSKLSHLTSDIVFLAQNLRLLKNHGELGIILPDSLITGHDFENFRKSLLTSHKLKALIELPEKIFPKTEARTHILIIEKNNITKSKVQLLISDKHGQCYDEIEVSSSSLSQRMDYTYHKWNQKKKKVGITKILGGIGVEIKRGQLTHKELKNINDKYIHTTNLKHASKIVLLSKKKENKLLNTYAIKNDILLARVGRGCVGKLSLVKEGHSLISDCIYRIRVPKQYLRFVWQSLKSPEGQQWLKANSHGVCARVISKKDLLKFPITLD